MSQVQSTVLPTDLFVRGRITCRTMDIPSGTVVNDDVSGAAAIEATKLQHQHQITHAQGSATTAAAEEKVIHVVYGATGTIVAINAGMVSPNVGAAACTVDLHVNGATVLDAVISLTSGETAFELVAGTIDTPALTDDDVVELVITATAGGGTLGTGLFVTVIIREDAQ